MHVRDCPKCQREPPKIGSPQTLQPGPPLPFLSLTVPTGGIAYGGGWVCKRKCPSGTKWGAQRVWATTLDPHAPSFK